jgi:hypothetical protein
MACSGAEPTTAGVSAIATSMLLCWFWSVNGGSTTQAFQTGRADREHCLNETEQQRHMDS